MEQKHQCSKIGLESQNSNPNFHFRLFPAPHLAFGRFHALLSSGMWSWTWIGLHRDGNGSGKNSCRTTKAPGWGRGVGSWERSWGVHPREKEAPGFTIPWQNGAARGRSGLELISLKGTEDFPINGEKSVAPVWFHLPVLCLFSAKAWWDFPWIFGLLMPSWVVERWDPDSSWQWLFPSFVFLQLILWVMGKSWFCPNPHFVLEGN